MNPTREAQENLRLEREETPGGEGSVEVGVRQGRHALVIVAVSALTLVAAWLRLHQLGGHGLWLDEACSVLYAHLSAGKFWRLMWKQEGNMVLYYVLLRGWVHVGDTEFLLRLPSVVFATASIPMMYVLGCDLFRKSTGMIAAALLSVHWFHVFFSQEARSYTLLIFLLLLSSWLFVRFTEEPDRWLYRISYPVVSALAMYAHLFAILVVAACWFSIGPVRARSVGLRRSVGAIATFLLLALPMEAFALFRNKGQLIWVPAVTLKALREAISTIAGYDSNLMLLLTLALVVVAVASALRSRSERNAFAVRVAGLWLIVPIAATLLYSLHRPLFYSRFLVICVPALLLLVAEGLRVVMGARSGLRWLWVPSFALMMALSVRATWRYYRAPMWPDWNSATRLILANQVPGDAVCFAGNGVEPFFYYMQRQTKIAWDALPEVYRHQGFKCLSSVPGNFSLEPSGYRRVWLITTDPSPQELAWVGENLVPRYGRPQPRGSFHGPIKIEILAGTTVARTYFSPPNTTHVDFGFLKHDFERSYLIALNLPTSNRKTRLDLAALRRRGIDVDRAVVGGKAVAI